MKIKLLRLMRILNKLFCCNIVGRIKIERFFKDKIVYNYLTVPDKCFKGQSQCKYIVEYGTR